MRGGLISDMSKLRKRFLKGAFLAISKSGLSERFLTSRDAVPRRVMDSLKANLLLQYPQDVQFEVTMKCNLNCIMCHQKKRRESKKKEVSLKDVKRIIDNFSVGPIKRVKLIGGEIFLRKDILEIISYLQQKNIGVNITTNGTLLNDRLSKKLSAFGNIKGMVFSIDGTEEVHNKIRRTSDGFSRTVSNLKKVSSLLTVIKVTCVLQKDNIGGVEEFMHACKEWGADIVSFMLEALFSKEDLSRTERMMRDLGDIKFFTTPSQQCGYDFQIDELLYARQKINTLAENIGILAYLTPPAASFNLTKFYSGDILNGTGNLTCPYLNRLVITESGNVLACPFIDLEFGNLLNQAIGDIWNSPRFREYRRLFLSEGPFPICRRCCVLTYVKG